MTRLFAIVLTYNEARNIIGCIETLRFADHILVVDSLSKDATPQLAREAGAEVIERPFVDYADQRNAALDAVEGRADWVLFIDADERVSAELAAEVRDKIAFPDFYAFHLPRHNYIFGTLTRGAGWFPDYQTRLLRAGFARYDVTKKVHEVVIVQGKEGTLVTPLTHYNYDHVAQFMAKQRRYVAYDAQILFEQGVRPRWRTFIGAPVRHFIWRFFTLNGYKDGWHGLRLSVLMAWYEWRKYRLLQGLWVQHHYAQGASGG